MPRPQKKRNVCCMPKNSCFIPGEFAINEAVHMTVDEHETIRLIDLEEYTQEECANQMQVSRTTVQGVYFSARKKIADAIVNGKKLIITGGDYHLCDGRNQKCCRANKKRCCKSI